MFGDFFFFERKVSNCHTKAVSGWSLGWTSESYLKDKFLVEVLFKYFMKSSGVSHLIIPKGVFHLIIPKNEVCILTRGIKIRETCKYSNSERHTLKT